MNDETDEVEDEEKRRGLIPPLLGPPTAESLSAPLQSPIAPAQHAAAVEAPASGASPLQHAGGADAPSTGPSPLQHSAQPQGPAGGQHTPGFESPPTAPDHALQHSSGPQSSGEQIAGQHTPGSPLHSDATQAQHVTGPESPGSDAVAQHSGLQTPKPPSRIRRVLQRAAQRPRGAALIGAGVVTVTIVTVAIVAAAQKDPPQREIAAASPTVAVDTTDAPAAAAPVTTRPTRPTAPATTAAPATTQVPTTTTEAVTTTTLPSAEGTYTATTSGFTLSAPEIGFSQSVPGSSGTLTLTGQCDGIGPCTAGFADGGIADPAATGYGDGSSDEFKAVVLTPTGAGGYSATLSFPVVDCGGAVSVNITMMVGAGPPSGAMDYNFPGSGADCPSVTWGFTFTSVKAG